MDYKSFMEALKGNQHKIDKNKNGKVDAHDFKLLRKEETEELEEATVKTQKYSWGTMKTVHHGSDFSIPLHPEHHEAIAKLKDQQEHKFKDETNRHWTAKRSGDDVHFQSANDGPKTTVKHADLKESEDRMVRSDYKVGASGRKSHKEIVFNDAESKDDKKMKEEVEQIDELSKGTLGSYAKKASRDAVITRKIGADFERKAVAARSPGMKAASNELSSRYKQKSFKRRDGLEKAVDRLTKEEVEQIDEANHREFASQGLMHPDMAKHMKTGQEMDFYHSKTGDKISGVVKHTTGGEVHIKANKDGKLGAGEVHKFKVSSDLKEDKMTTQKDKNGKLISFKYEGDWKKSTEKKEGSGKAANLAGQAMQRMAKANEQAPVAPVPDRKYIKGTPENLALKASRKPINGMPTNKIKEEKDEQEYGYEGDMALNQLATLTRCAEMIKEILKPDTDMPEWVQSKITLATDYIQTAADYMHSEMNEAKTVEVKVNHAGDAPHEEKWEPVKKIKKPVVESFDDEGNLISNKISYKEFMLEYTPGAGGVTQIKGRSYGASYVDPEGADDYDDKKPMKPAAEKRGRGRPAGAKSGARKITGTSKLMNK
jgi:hypothetical protein